RRVELRVLRNWSIVKEVPDVVKGIARAISPERRVNREETGEFSSHLQGVSAGDFGENVLRAVGPLVEAVERTDTQAIELDAARIVKSNLRQSPRSVRIAVQISVFPPSCICASLINKGRAKGVVPDQGRGTVCEIRVEQVHQTRTIAVEARAVVWHPIHA